jgi:predicted HNH restriction endonuclease
MPAKQQQVSGPFDVKVTPQKPDTQIARAAALGRLTIDKRYHGDLEATAKGEMLATQTETKGSAAYVALERVTGKLQGHNGSFVLQHTATMDRGATNSSITVVPDSGTGQLTGLSGEMRIHVDPEGRHSYEFDFRIEPLPAA